MLFVELWGPAVIIYLVGAWYRHRAEYSAYRDKVRAEKRKREYEANPDFCDLCGGVIEFGTATKPWGEWFGYGSVPATNTWDSPSDPSRVCHRGCWYREQGVQERLRNPFDPARDVLEEAKRTFNQLW